MGAEVALLLCVDVEGQAGGFPSICFFLLAPSLSDGQKKGPLFFSSEAMCPNFVIGRLIQKKKSAAAAALERCNGPCPKITWHLLA